MLCGAQGGVFLRTRRGQGARSARARGSRGNAMFPCLRQACPLRTAAVLFCGRDANKKPAPLGQEDQGGTPCSPALGRLVRCGRRLSFSLRTRRGQGARSARARGSRGNAMFPLRPSGLPIPHRPGAAAPDPGVGSIFPRVGWNIHRGVQVKEFCVFYVA